jgi:hypothetical protein
MAPTITAPVEDEKTDMQDFTIVYTEEASATQYNVQIARDSGFTDVVIDQTGITDLFWQINPLLDDDEYYVRVRGFVGSWQSWSSTRTFRITAIAIRPSGQRLGSMGGGAFAL